MLALSDSVALLVSVALALAFLAAVMWATRLLLLRRRRDHVDTVAWVIVSGVTGATLSGLAAALI